MRPQLLELADAAVADKEEWVHIIGRSVGRLEGQLDLQGVLQESTVVRDTVAELRHRLEATGAEQASTSNFRPLEEAYLSRRLVGGALPSQGTHRQHAHFLLRDGAVPVSPQRPQQVVAAAVATAAAAIPSPTDQAAIGQPSAMSSGASGRTLQHTQSGATSGSARRGTALATDMFRSSRPATLSRPPAAVTAHATPGHDQRERKGAARMVKAKIIDVNEAIQLHKQMAQEKDKGHMADKDEAGPSTDAAAAPMGWASLA
ncbi:hypothetical protein WJX72_005734 [[Myrmecia] bisecta]|uniref:Uncharacterized protein n=1 Tax=[Myrmecia] bisecta TaxID=41462 RepID=A0AAW1Q7H4_9CHLO